ncbi:MAG TPA: hypothetical protein VFF16_10525, partial [Telluria sp.]|nr:hypothetical protein [Telluria sp.]
MSVILASEGVVAQPGGVLHFSDFLTTDAYPGYEYVVLIGLDLERYPQGTNVARGALSGNGHTLDFTQRSGDYHSCSAIFTYTTNGYFNDTLGYLQDLTYVAPPNTGRVEVFTLHGFGAQGTPDAALKSTLETALTSSDLFSVGAYPAWTDLNKTAHTPVFYPGYPGAASGLIGTLSFVTRTDLVDSSPHVATPTEIAAVAEAYVGGVWDQAGGWVLANSIAASAGSALPLSALVPNPEDAAPSSAGQWRVEFNSLDASLYDQSTWMARLRPGDIVTFGNREGGGGKIFTVVDGTGYAAWIVDCTG